MAFVPEAIVSKIVEDLIALPIEEFKEHVRLVVGVKDEVRKLTENFKAIQAVVADAERKQINDGSIKLWLDGLKEVSYEIDDVLDEWRSTLLLKSRHRATASSGRITRKWMLQVCPFITSCCFRFDEIGHRHDIALKIKALNITLNEIVKRRINYQLVPYMSVGLGEQNQQRITTSGINKMEVKGRKKEEKKIIDMLLTESNDVPQVVSIVGMGGLGKTTLAQLAYNNESIRNLFHERIWVCVSDPFDEIKIAKSILESLKASVGSELEILLRDISSKIAEKKYLLVLDDVWNEDSDKWKKLKNALTCGLRGSKVLLTTRKETVAQIMGCEEVKTLKPGMLSNEECWSIICNEVELSWRRKEDLQLLEDIGIKIARKCKGLPLAAKTLGGLLRFKFHRKEWQSVLDNQMWELGKEEVTIEKHLFTPLWLSYFDLSSVERQCLSYCVLFPKDYSIIKDELIKMWMSQDYLKDTKYRDMKIVGEEVFRNLSARSFFQDFKTVWYDEIWSFKIHDMVHDFILFISNKECVSLDEFKDERDEGLDKSLHHLFVLPTSMDKFGNFMSSFKKLRSLNVSNCKGLDLCRLFKEITCLRSLFLYGCDLREIPSEIGRLIHLRLLDVSFNKELSELPETISDLCNLLCLKSIQCYNLKELPLWIEKVSNLRYLDEVYLTQGVGKLHALREVHFLVRTEACSLEYLKNMNHLNYVYIELGRNVNHVNGAKQAQLNLKKDLVTMSLSFEKNHLNYEEVVEYGEDEEVLETLQPCSTLENLEIYRYRGANLYPSWLLSLQHVTTVKLYDWFNCECLPPLGKLPFLTALKLSYFVKVKKVGVEFLGIDVKLYYDWAFPKLKSLEFVGLFEWEEWAMDDRVSIMPCLTQLVVYRCDKLKAIPDHLYQKVTLKDIEIINSPLLEECYRKWKEGRSSG